MPIFKIGADPELFVNKGGKPVAACGLIPGNKDEPFKVEEGAVQVDGLALEFNIDPVEVDTDKYGSVIAAAEQFDARVLKVMAQLKKMIKGHTFDISSSREFDKEYYDSLPDDAKILGCEPDFNAWAEGKINPRPSGETSLRGAGGHIHVGWGSDIPVDHPDHIEICCHVVRQLDAAAGMLMLLYDTDNRRREVYGKAGAFRPKSYGVEWRSPSNAWLTTKARRKAIFQVVVNTLSQMSKGQEYKLQDVEEIINSGDRRAAYDILNYRNYPNINIDPRTYDDLPRPSGKFLI